jgi:hypothetical protein
VVLRVDKKAKNNKTIEEKEENLTGEMDLIQEQV